MLEMIIHVVVVLTELIWRASSLDFVRYINFALDEIFYVVFCYSGRFPFAILNL